MFRGRFMSKSTMRGAGVKLGRVAEGFFTTEENEATQRSPRERHKCRPYRCWINGDGTDKSAKPLD